MTAVIMAMGIAGGIERANGVMMPLLFVLFLGLGVYIFSLPGSSAGYRYIFTINPKGLLDPRLWIYALDRHSSLCPLPEMELLSMVLT